jgi:FkbM family methyltransferase
MVGQGYSTLISRLLRVGDCVLDVGANVGYFSATCALAVGPKGSVHAIEANPSLVDRLRALPANVIDSPIRVHSMAVWSSTGSLPFHVATVSGWSSLIENDTFRTTQVVQVLSMTLDEFVQRNSIQQVRFLKFDIEGAEFDALLGADKFLEARQADFILLEAERHRLKAFGRSGEDIANFMDARGYRVVCCIDSERIVPASHKLHIPGSFNGDYLYAKEDLSQAAVHSIFGNQGRPSFASIGNQ